MPVKHLSKDAVGRYVEQCNAIMNAARDSKLWIEYAFEQQERANELEAKLAAKTEIFDRVLDERDMALDKGISLNNQLRVLEMKKPPKKRRK